MNSYWQNEFHHEDTHTPCDDAYLTLYHSLIPNSLSLFDYRCHWDELLLAE